MPDKNDFNNDVLAERRRFPRLVTSVDIEYEIVKEKLSPKETVTKNIAAGGICLIVYEKIAVGSFLSLKLHLPENHLVIQARGKVIWSSHFTIDGDKRDRYDLGIEFIEISESDQKKLGQYVFRLIK